MKSAPTIQTLAIGLATLVLWGCQMQGIPFHGPNDAGPDEPDASSDTAMICAPGQRTCVGPAVRICNRDGTDFVLDECPASSTCEEGQCQRLQTECSAADDATAQPFSIRPRVLSFVTGDDLKSTTQRLYITNCSDNTPLTIDQVFLREDLIRNPDDRRDPDLRGRLEDAFRLDNRYELQDQELPPGATQEVRVRYHPAHDYTRVDRRLRLEILGASHKQFYILLNPRVHCVTATSQIDVGHVGSTVARRAYLQNCGTEPVEIKGIRVEPNKPESTTTVDISLDIDDDLPAIQPGESRSTTFEVRRLTDGEINHRIVYELADPGHFERSTIITQVTGQSVPGGCREVTLAQPRVWVEPDQEIHSWQASATIGETLHFELAAPHPEAGQWSLALRPPFGSRAQLESASEAVVTPGKHSFVPDIAGTYRVDIDHFDDDHLGLCDPPSLIVEVEPAADLYVDLQWLSHGDFILDDICHGCGVDLNLHLLASDQFDSGIQHWIHAELGCYGLGEMPADEDLPGLRAPVVADCHSSGGSVESLSISGATREVLTVEHVESRYYAIGVHAWSMYGFANATAKLSVYGRGQPVEDVVIDPVFWGEERPSESDDLQVHRFEQPRGWWVYGLWDAQTNTLLPFPPQTDGAGRQP